MRKSTSAATAAAVLAATFGLLAVAAAQPAYDAAAGLPPDAQAKIGDQALVQIYCLNARWRSGQLLAVLDAAGELLPTALSNAAAVGVKVKAPDLAGLRSAAVSKIDDICGAQTLAEAEQAGDDLVALGQQARQRFAQLESDLESGMAKRGNEIRQKIEKAVEPAVQAETARLNADLQALAAQEAAKAKATVEGELASRSFATASQAQDYVNQRLPQVEAQAQATVKALTEQARASLKSLADAKAAEAAPADKDQVEAVSQELRVLAARIRAGAAARFSPYQSYRSQAQAKRRQTLVRYVDERIAVANLDLGQRNADIELYMQTDPTAMSVGQIIQAMQTDRGMLDAALGKSADSGNEAGFRQAVDDFSRLWERYRQKTSEMFKTPERVCDLAGQQISAAKASMNSSLGQISQLRTGCAGQTDTDCLKVMGLAGRFSEISSQVKGVLSEISRVEKLCADSKTAGQLDPEILTTLDSLARKGQAVDAAGQALAGERHDYGDWVDGPAESVCQDNLPRLGAGQTELDRVHGVWDTKLEACLSQALPSSVCAVFDGLKGEIASLQTKTADLKSKSDAFRSACQYVSPTVTAAGLWDQFDRYLESFGDVDVLVKSINYQSAGLSDPSQACQAGQPLAEASARRYGQTVERMRRRLDEVGSYLIGCQATPDTQDCRRLRQAADRAGQVESHYLVFANQYWQVEVACRGASPSAGLDSLTGQIDDLADFGQAGQDKAAEVIKELQGIEALFRS